MCGRHTVLLVVFSFLLFEADDCDCLPNPVFWDVDMCAPADRFCFFLNGLSSLERELSHIHSIYSVFIKCLGSISVERVLFTADFCSSYATPEAHREHHVERVRDSDLRWTVVRAPRLTDAAGTGDAAADDGERAGAPTRVGGGGARPSRGHLLPPRVAPRGPTTDPVPPGVASDPFFGDTSSRPAV